MKRYLPLIVALILVAGALLSAQLLQPGPGWVTDPKTGCRVWEPSPQGETVSWSGPCENNLAQGRGVLQWFKDGKPNGRYDGEVSGGKMNGRGLYTFPNGDRFDGEYRDGVRSGRAVYTWATTASRASTATTSGRARAFTPLRAAAATTASFATTSATARAF